MKPHLPRLLTAALLASFTVVPAFSSELLDDYETQVEVWDSSFLSDYTSNSTTDYVAFLLGLDIAVPSDIKLNGGNLLFTTYEEVPPVSLEFTGSNSSALTNQSSLVFDTLSGLSFASYKERALYTSGNMVIQNVNDGVEDSENPDVLFTGNSASSSYTYGGAIYADSVSITGNGDVNFIENYSINASDSYGESHGGAIYARSGDVSNSGNRDVTFSGNSCVLALNRYDHEAAPFVASGGAICAYGGGVTISGNRNVSFTGNSVSVSVRADGYLHGGAIYAYRGGVSITGNETVCFEKNYERENSTYRLRSIYVDGGSLNLSAKTGGHITFYDSVYGGMTALNADYTDADGVTQKAKGTIIFSGQHTKDHLDAIL